jgi:class 3 adenylate cyclase
MGCCFENDHECSYEIIWNKQSKNFVTKQAPNIFILLSTLLGYGLTREFSTAFIVGSTLTCIKLFLGLMKTKEDYSSITKEFEVYNREAEEKYVELQLSKNKLDENYKESVIIEIISREVQKSNKLETILNSALDGICKNFDFDRAFIMLADNVKKEIKTAAVAGVYEGAEDVWKFKIDVSKKRENQQVASSVFLTGNSIMINNVDEHLFQLNDASRYLIAKLKTQGFCIVPIPAWNDCNWGILIADKSSKRSELDRRDLVLLQKIALHLGLALDKQAQIESEVKIRKIFEKFVPSAILSQVTSVSEPNLGGQTKNIVCMFIDIRGFTKMSSSLAPQTTLELLNTFYDEVYKISHKYSGIIDKYLGDGVLLSWGAHQNTEANSHKAVQTAQEIILSLEKINFENTNRGLPRIDIGIGIHEGSAIAGNVGSQDRMEFTIIGNTVNIASRLEGLCKTYDCNIVMSEDVLNKLPVEIQNDYKKINDAKIKGIENDIVIGINKPLKIGNVA